MKPTDPILARCRELMSAYTDEQVLAELGDDRTALAVRITVDLALYKQFQCGVQVARTRFVYVLRERREARAMRGEE